MLIKFIINRGRYKRNKSILIANGFKRKKLSFVKEYNDGFTAFISIKDAIECSEDKIINSISYLNALNTTVTNGKILWNLTD